MIPIQDNYEYFSLLLIICLYTGKWFHLLLFFVVIQRVKARAMPSPHQPPTKGDNTVSVAQGSTATPGATKQLL